MADKKDIPNIDLTPEDELEKGTLSNDKNGDGIDDRHDDLVHSAKYDSVLEAYKAKDGFLEGIWEAVKETTAGRNTVGRVIGMGLDVAGLFVPPIGNFRRKAKNVLNLNQSNEMKDILKRAFTTDGGSFLRVRDENGNFSLVAIGATIIRLVLVLGVFYAADYFGLPVQDILTFIFSG